MTFTDLREFLPPVVALSAIPKPASRPTPDSLVNNPSEESDEREVVVDRNMGWISSRL